MREGAGKEERSILGEDDRSVDERKRGGKMRGWEETKGESSNWKKVEGRETKSSQKENVLIRSSLV